MRMDRFTTLAQEALSGAQSLAVGESHAELTPLHLLAALLDDAGGIGHSLLDKAGVNPDQITQIVTSELSRLPTVSGSQAAVGSEMIEVLAIAEKESKELGDSYVSCEHLLLALAEVKSSANTCSWPWPR